MTSPSSNPSGSLSELHVHIVSKGHENLDATKSSCFGNHPPFLSSTSPFPKHAADLDGTRFWNYLTIRKYNKEVHLSIVKRFLIFQNFGKGLLRSKSPAQEKSSWVSFYIELYYRGLSHQTLSTELFVRFSVQIQTLLWLSVVKLTFLLGRSVRLANFQS